MPIRKEMLLALLFLLSTFALLSLTIHKQIIMPGFVQLEREEAEKDIRRAVSALESEVSHLDNLNYDWAAWDDSYEFIIDHNEDYIESNLVDSTFTDNHINLIYLIDKADKVIWSRIFDLEEEEDIEISEFPTTVFPKDHPLLGLDSTTAFHAGIMLTSQGPMLVSARPITTSNMEGPLRGTLVMGRLLTTEYIERLSTQTQTALNIWQINSDSFPEKYKPVLPVLNNENNLLISELSDSKLDIFTSVADINNTPALLFKLDIKRDISSKGKGISLYSFWLNNFIGLLLTTMFLILLRKRLIYPLEVLVSHFTDVGRSYDLSRFLQLKGCAEIKILGSEYNKMSESLDSNRKDLVDQSYYSGIAEITSGVIHNIRNTITPMVTDIALLKEKCEYLPVGNMTSAFGELSNTKLDPERKEKLISFFGKSLEHLANLKETVAEKMDRMDEQSYLTNKLLDDLEEFAHAGFVPEKFVTQQMIDDAAALFHNRFPDVLLDIALGEIGTIKSHRSVLVLVFMNLFYNAGEAIALSGQKTGLIKLTARSEKEKDKPILHFELSDNGTGISAEDLPKIFKRGFSTKDKKISGIGLHWCANTITTLRGKLYATSEGEGHGTCFHVLLPQDISD